MISGLKTGVEETILKLFDELSYTYSWMPESCNNIHYFNGWSSNKSFYVNSKVILPASAFDQIFKKMKIVQVSHRFHFGIIFHYLLFD